jgi:hypothetical protein
MSSSGKKWRQPFRMENNHNNLQKDGANQVKAIAYIFCYK